MEKIFVRDAVRRAVLSILLIIGVALTLNSAFAAQSVTLEWNPSTDPSVTGYNLYYGAASRTYTNKIDVGNSTNVTVNGLVEGVTYYFAATAYNILGAESDYSTEVSYTVPVPAGNQPPTLTAIPNLTINEDAAQQFLTEQMPRLPEGVRKEIIARAYFDSLVQEAEEIQDIAEIQMRGLAAIEILEKAIAEIEKEPEEA